LDSSRYRPGFANLVANSHFSRKEDTPYGLILNQALLRVPRQHLMRVVAGLNFKLRTRAAYSIFTLPLWERSPSGILAYGRNNRISA
jgi:hypothetical protein